MDALGTFKWLEKALDSGQGSRRRSSERPENAYLQIETYLNQSEKVVEICFVLKSLLEKRFLDRCA